MVIACVRRGAFIIYINPFLLQFKEHIGVNMVNIELLLNIGENIV